MPEITYFETSGIEYTDKTLQIAKEYAEENGIRSIDPSLLETIPFSSGALNHRDYSSGIEREELIANQLKTHPF